MDRDLAPPPDPLFCFNLHLTSTVTYLTLENRTSDNGVLECSIQSFVTKKGFQRIENRNYKQGVNETLHNAIQNSCKQRKCYNIQKLIKEVIIVIKISGQLRTKGTSKSNDNLPWGQEFCCWWLNSRRCMRAQTDSVSCFGNRG